MRHLTTWVIVAMAGLTACGGTRPSSGSAALRSAVEVARTPDVLEVRTSRPAYLAVVAFTPSSSPAIARGGPEPGRHLIPLEGSPLGTAGHGGMPWLTGSTATPNPYSPATCQMSREIVGRDPQGRPTYSTVSRCSYVPLPDPVTYQARRSRPSYFLVIATDAPVSDALLAKAVAGVPATADGRLAARYVRNTLFHDSTDQWAVVVK